MATKSVQRQASIGLKRVYDPPSADDGMRVLVDRLWPRGLSKDAAKVDVWMKEAAPSAELRKWFHHEPERWNEFKHRYRQELAANVDAVEYLRELAKSKPLTLLFAAHDTEHNNAVVLLDFLQHGHAPRPQTSPAQAR
ncbi:putative uroporphyrin-III c-methyltransferase [Hyphomicrobium sulfonivorans]|uniref:Putative uroporphyrin-III c-methyltransferase n=1 Tax=Hyphomicrobium sulfonivorans TaxID=121290 RepID=A0A109BB35_HYPSL|nr:DUF488 domain-containing protein [Hyphomicrobium sulfonivorans]KWT65516.1 putative uroporphyrin-III c-methyltransferase [Hyphomicrobium sulfonivorans]